jgi:hypothetical protein
MKLFYDGKSGYKVYKINILGYKCFLHETVHCGYQIQVPTGRSKKDKEMFDKLVYFNKGVYNGSDKEKVIAKVKKFIKDNK